MENSRNQTWLPTCLVKVDLLKMYRAGNKLFLSETMNVREI